MDVGGRAKQEARAELATRQSLLANGFSTV